MLELRSNLGLLVGREDIHDAVDGSGCTVGVKRGECQVSRFGDAQGGFHRLQVSHFSDQHDIGIFAQRHSESIGK